MKGICSYKDKTCKFTHPQVCEGWRKGQCSDSKKCNKLHSERPVQRARKLHSLANQHTPEKKKQRKKSRDSSNKSSGSHKSNRSNGKGKGKKPKKKKDTKPTKKDSGHAKKQSPPH